MKIKAFSLMEILISFVIITIGILGLVAIIIYARGNSQSINTRIQALNAANAIIAYIPDKLPSFTGDTSYVDIYAPPFDITNLFTDFQKRNLKRKIYINLYQPGDTKFSKTREVTVNIKFSTQNNKNIVIHLTKILNY